MDPTLCTQPLELELSSEMRGVAQPATTLGKYPLIYLASPYSHPDPRVCQARFQTACRAAAALLSAGEIVFSPIAHSHPIAAHGLPTAWEYWECADRELLRRCDELLVLMLPGWQESRGVQAEIATARELGMPVRYLAPSTTFPTSR